MLVVRVCSIRGPAGARVQGPQPPQRCLVLPTEAVPSVGSAAEFADAALLLTPGCRHLRSAVDVADLASAACRAWTLPDLALTELVTELGQREYDRLHMSPALISVATDNAEVCSAVAVTSRTTCLLRPKRYVRSRCLVPIMFRASLLSCRNTCKQGRCPRCAPRSPRPRPTSTPHRRHARATKPSSRSSLPCCRRLKPLRTARRRPRWCSRCSLTRRCHPAAARCCCSRFQTCRRASYAAQRRVQSPLCKYVHCVQPDHEAAALGYRHHNRAREAHTTIAPLCCRSRPSRATPYPSPRT
jgi:hypothetical protein